MRVAYLTDVEGSFNKLKSFVDVTPGVSFADSFAGDEHKNARIVVDDGFIFVFGGDAVDRGPWSRKVCSILLEAKLRQPERVVLLGGNRDINKLRLPRELDGAVPKRAPPEVVALFRDQKPALLRWIFHNTMGAQPAFEHRREELVATGNNSGDDDVVRSFLTDLLPPAGLHFRYLQQTQLAFRLGKTLYVHGGVDDECLGKVPGEVDVDDVDGWVFALNNFYRSQLALFAEHPMVVDKDPPWLPLILYQAPQSKAGRNPQSVVYGRFGNDPWNNPRLPSSSTLRWLSDRGIARVVVGHTPCGDLPTFLRPPDDWQTPVELIIADNSRARLDHGNSVVIEDEGVSIKAKTTLDDGTTVDVDYQVELHGGDRCVGRLTDDGSLVKAVVSDRAYLFRFGPQWVLQQTAVPVASLTSLRAPLDGT